jgi:hypothetical protein
MARIAYSDDEDYPGQFELWQANCDRSFDGRMGQAVLREMEAALLVLPRKRLVANAVACNGDVCAVGAYLALKRSQERSIPIDAAQRELESELGEDWVQEDLDTSELGEKAGMPHLVAWKLVSLNDIELETEFIVAEGPNRWGNEHFYQHGIPTHVDVTPERRYELVLAFVRERIKQAA